MELPEPWIKETCHPSSHDIQVDNGQRCFPIPLGVTPKISKNKKLPEINNQQSHLQTKFHPIFPKTLEFSHFLGPARHSNGFKQGNQRNQITIAQACRAEGLMGANHYSWHGYAKKPCLNRCIFAVMFLQNLGQHKLNGYGMLRFHMVTKLPCAPRCYDARQDIWFVVGTLVHPARNQDICYQKPRCPPTCRMYGDSTSQALARSFNEQSRAITSISRVATGLPHLTRGVVGGLSVSLSSMCMRTCTGKDPCYPVDWNWFFRRKHVFQPTLLSSWLAVPALQIL